jgi:ubiquinone/menaquinone biosynthesis C-methylase UbiE
MKKSMMAALGRQFGRPHGTLGSIAGAIMAFENRAVNRLVVDELRIAPADVVLELGCGPGVGLAEAATRASAGRVVGVDPSPVMVRQAGRRNRRAVVDDRVSVSCAPAEDLPFPDDGFDCAFAVNSVQHWESVPDGLDELHRVLRPGGRLVLARRLQRAGGPGVDPHSRGASEPEVEAFLVGLREAGFVGVERHDHPLARETLVTFSGAAR